jgi:hypothetical protein
VQLIDEHMGRINTVTPTPTPPTVDPHSSIALLIAGVVVAIAVVVTVYLIRRSGARRSQ